MTKTDATLRAFRIWHKAFHRPVVIPMAIVLALVAGGASAQVQAPSPEDRAAAARQAEQLQQEMQERIRRQQQLDLAPDRAPTQLDVPRPTPPSRTSTVCRDVERISVVGVTLIDAERLQAITAAFEGSCLGIGEIESLLGEITAAYMSRGYVAARAYLPAQDLSGGELRIEVEEGRIEGFSVKDGERRSISIANVAPRRVGKPLNLRDLEQALDQINRLASNDATLNILPGSTAGDSIVEFSNAPGRRLHATLSFDNSGQKSTGDTQLGLSVGLDNPLRFNDFFSVTHRRSQPYSSSEKASVMNNVSWVLPLGYTTLGITASKSKYESLFTGPSGTAFQSRGDSETYSLRADHVLWRGRGGQWRIAGTLTNKVSNNYLANAFLEVSSRRLTVLDVDSSYSTALLGGALSVDVGVARGLDWLDAQEDARGLPDTAPRAQFTKLKYGAVYFKGFDRDGRRLMLTSQLSGQRALDVLFGSERMSIGSPFTVRGFREDSLAGDNGLYWRNDLSLSYPLMLGQRPGMLRPYLGVDIGRVWNRYVDEVGQGRLSSASVGLAVHVRPLSLDLVHSRPIDTPDSKPDLGGSTYFTLSLSF